MDVVASYYSEICTDCCLVAATNYPLAQNLGDITSISKATIAAIVKQWPGCAWLLVAGPPCQDVSLLNSAASGAWGNHSSLREEFGRVYRIFSELLPADRLLAFMECTRMEDEDRRAYDAIFGRPPVEICSSFAVPMTRPRLWWFNRDVCWEQFAEVTVSGSVCKVQPPWQRRKVETLLEPGWLPANPNFQKPTFAFRCMTRSVPRKSPMDDPRGIETCDQATLARWEADWYAQSPYQYKLSNMVRSKRGTVRRLLVVEEERMMGFPTHFTAPLLQLDLHDYMYEHRRRSLLGNSWNVFVVMFILQCLGIGLSSQATGQETAEPFFSDECLQGSHALLQEALFAAASDLVNVFPEPGDHVPFTQSLPRPVPRLLGPDFAELWAAQSCGVVAGFQSRYHGFAVSKQKMIAAGLCPKVHCVVASALSSPLDALPELPDDLRFACDQVLRHDYEIWVRQQQRKFGAIIKRAQKLPQRLKPFRTPAALATCAGVEPQIVLLLTYLMQWPDRGLALLPTIGASVVGHIPSAAIYRHSDKEATLTMEEWLQTADRWNRSILSLPPPSTEQAQAVWEASLSEQTEGTMGRWYTYEELNAVYGIGQWRAMVRFAVQQGEKWRCIDNGRTGDHNETVTCIDKIHTTSVDVAMAIAAYLHAKEDPTQRQPQVRATRDMRKAYRQIPISEEQGRFQIVAVWNPKLHCFLFAHLHGLAFGLYASVAHFNRIPAFIIAVARRFFGIPAIAYFDDVRLHATTRYGQLVWNTFDWLLATIGYVFDPSKDVPMGPVGNFLGFVENLSCAHTQYTASLTPKDEFVTNIQRQMIAALQSGHLAHGDARSLRGKLLHLSNSMTGRVGRGQTYAFEQLLQSESTAIPPALVTCLVFFLRLIELKPWRVFQLTRQSEVDFIVYTDAAATGEGRSQIVTVSFVALSDNFCRAGRATLSADTLGSFGEKATYIAHGEAMACLFYLWHMKNQLRNKSVIHFVDNLGVLSALCKGSSAVFDVGHIVSATLMTEAALGMRSWKEHVDSKANLADCGTKEVDDYVTAMGINWETLELPPWPKDLRSASSDEWLRWYKDNSSSHSK